MNSAYWTSALRFGSCKRQMWRTTGIRWVRALISGMCTLLVCASRTTRDRGASRSVLRAWLSVGDVSSRTKGERPSGRRASACGRWVKARRKPGGRSPFALDPVCDPRCDPIRRRLSTARQATTDAQLTVLRAQLRRSPASRSGGPMGAESGADAWATRGASVLVTRWPLTTRPPSHRTVRT